MHKTILILGLSIACGTTPVDPVAKEIAVVRPTQVQSVSLDYKATPNANALTSSKLLAVGRSGPLSIVGGLSGLFEITSDGLKQIDTQAVVAIVKYHDGSLVVANNQGLYVYNASLELSPINQALGLAKITSLATREQQLWIGTDLGLFVYESQKLHSFDETMSVVSLQSFANSNDMVVETSLGFEVYRLTDDTWSRLSLADEVSVSHLAPATNNRIIGLSSGALLQRIEIENQKAVWRAMATTTAVDDPGARGVEAIATNPSTGAVWVIEASHFSRIDPKEGNISILARPSTITTVQSAAVSSDGSLWIYDGSHLHELSQSGEIITYETIKAMSTSSCNRCHKTLGTAPMALGTYDEWVANVDKIIERLENQSMPPPGTPLVGGTADTVKQWKALGMPQ